MPSSSSGMPDEPSGSRASAHWVALVSIAIVAILVRIAFFTGFFGSDDVNYAASAIDIANGEWKTYSYAGDWRYGVNLPNALFVKLLGASEFSVNFWSLLCSVAEVVLVYLFAYRLWGYRAALLSAAAIGLLPLHVHLAGVLRPDAPLAFFITLSFYLFWEAERRQSAAWYFATGVAAGFVFWTKESAPIYGAVFAIYALLQRTWNFKWLWVVLGGTLMVGVNCLLLWKITGDPLHIFRVSLAEKDLFNIYALTQGETSPWYYFHYMFVDIKHLWIMPYLALGAIVVWLRQALRQRSLDTRTGYVVLWALGLLAVFSFTPLSFSPVLLITKQTNYMLIFVAPFCLLAGRFLSTLRMGWLAAWSVVYVAGALTLAGLEQQVVHVFTANSRAAVTYAQTVSGVPVYGMTNAYNAATFDRLMRNDPYGARAVRNMSELISSVRERVPGESALERRIIGYVIVDLQTASWGGNPITRLSEVPECWQRVSELRPSEQFGLGRYAALAISASLRILPAFARDRLASEVEAVVRPRPAYVYAVHDDCDSSLGRRKTR